MRKFNGTIDTLRARCAMARILGLFRPECAHRADEALSLGVDDVVVGPEHLRRTLSALRWEVAIVEGFLRNSFLINDWLGSFSEYLQRKNLTTSCRQPSRRSKIFGYRTGIGRLGPAWK